MKKILTLFAVLLVIAACNSSNDTPPVTDSLNKTTSPIDTVKIDTVKPTDSIIKG